MEHFVYPVEGKYALSLMNLLHTLFVGRYTTHGREKSRLHDWRHSCHFVDTVVAAWFMTVIFSWFNLYLTIWQAVGIVVLIKSITMVVNDK